MSTPCELWLVGRLLPSLRVVAEIRAIAHPDRLVLEKTIEEQGDALLGQVEAILRTMIPGAIFTLEIRHSEMETPVTRALKALLLAQQSFFDPKPGKEAVDAVNASILELCGVTGRRR